MKACDYVENWLKDHQSDIGVAPMKWGRPEKNPESFVAWYETDTHLIDVSCWNNACCLDITALNKKTEKEDFIVIGDCDGEKGLFERLSQFLIWLKGT